MNKMTIDDVTINFTHLKRETLLSDWQWLVDKHDLPILITSIGDVFIQNKNTNEMKFLDTGYGVLKDIAPHPEELRVLLKNEDFALDHLPFNAVSGMLDKGVALPKGQIYSYKILPALGGAHSLDNLEPCDIHVHLSISGQIHQQIKDLPPGTKVENIKIKQPTSKPWWKFW